MPARLIDGKALAAKIRAEIREETARLKETRNIVPGIAVIRVGDDPASKVYVGGKKKAAEEVGFRAWEFHYPANVTQNELFDRIRQINEDPAIHMVLLQLPVPKHLDPDALIVAVRPDKDADGFHPVNAGNLFLGRPGIRPCTPAGVMRMLEEIDFKPAGKKAVVVGRSNIVGKPMATLLTMADATVSICHRKSDTESEVRSADLVVAAAGVINAVRGDWIKPGAVVIDVGMNRNEAGKLTGDVEFEAAAQRASWITPVPGGVGPMTIALLMHNTLVAAASH